MNKDYKAINKQCLDCMLDQMVYNSGYIIDTLVDRGYKIVDVTVGAGDVKYNKKIYPYVTKPISYPCNPNGISLIINHDEILKTIEDSVPDKDKYFIAMYMPIHLDDLGAQVRFVACFDVIKI